VPTERRKTGSIPDDELAALSIQEYRPGGSTNPYDRVGKAGEVETTRPPAQRTDLRKLSEWIKLRRELEARRARGEDVEDP
jgi:hypothetical protein